ncbi:MAG: hypothetical protein VKJ64_21925 [Leptolyngbyaceae bacterium]|nr:hypothetical protein [Leptolyngbyaceae bacterium]
MGSKNKNFSKNKNKGNQSQSKATPPQSIKPPSAAQAISPKSPENDKFKGLQSYGLDQIAQRLVLDAKKRDPDSLNQAHKMRMATAYGLERFWGEHLRLQPKDASKQLKDANKSQYWKETWDELVGVMAIAGFTIPNDSVDGNDVDSVKAMSAKLWQLDLEVQRVALAVLTQLCDCMVWWTQRYK